MVLNKGVRGLSAGLGKRGRFEIIASIVEICRDRPTQKTRIMYRCNLSFEQLRKYLDYLTKAGFLKAVSENGKEYYQATEKGREFLAAFRRLQGLAGSKSNIP